MAWRTEIRRLAYGFAVGMLVVGVLLGMAASFLGGQVAARLQAADAEFTAAAGRGALSIFPEILAGYFTGSADPVAASRFLVVGKDEVEGSGRQAVLTDTLLVVSYRPSQGAVKLLSLPRDWYHPGLATKINALLTYGAQRDPKQPARLLRATVEEMLGVPIDHVVELSLSDVKDVVDTIGGLEIEVRRGFTDDQFPREGVDVTAVADPGLLYETVSFQPGPQVMDGSTALKFMRSRNSADPLEGNDEARIRRQQQVIEALVNSLQSPRVVGDGRTLGKLYRWYADNFQAEVSLFELGRLAGSLADSRKVPQLTKVELPVTNEAVATESATLLVHPATQKYGQWVYEAEDPSFAELHRFIEAQGI